MSQHQSILNFIIGWAEWVTLIKTYRWQNGLSCPSCGSEQVIKWCKYRDVWQRYYCKGCGKTFNDKTGTIFHYSHLSFEEWSLFLGLYIYLHYSARGIAKLLGRASRTLHRLVKKLMRYLMGADLKEKTLEGIVEIDEIYLCNGLKGRNNQELIRQNGRKSRWRGKRGKRGRGNYFDDKVPVIGFVQRGTKKFRLEVVERLDKEVIELIKEVVVSGSRIDTDDYGLYNPLGQSGYEHHMVNHSQMRYAQDDVRVNGDENLFSLLRPFMRVHRGIAKYNTDKYLLVFTLHRQVYQMEIEDAVREILRVLLLWLWFTNKIRHIERNFLPLVECKTIAVGFIFPR